MAQHSSNSQPPSAKPHSPFSSHPAYGHLDELRLRALAYADTHGVSAAANHFSIGRQSIYNWRRTLKGAYKMTTKEQG